MKKGWQFLLLMLAFVLVLSACFPVLVPGPGRDQGQDQDQGRVTWSRCRHRRHCRDHRDPDNGMPLLHPCSERGFPFLDRIVTG